VNVDRRGWGTSAVRGRILVAAAVLMGAACVLLGGGSHSGHAGLGRVAAFPEMAASLSAVSDSVSLQEIGSRQADAQVRAHSLLSGLPLRFEPNQGQGNLDRADSRARFVARGPGFGLFLGAEGATLTLLSRDRSRQNSAAQVDAVQMKLSGANQAPSLTGLDLLPGKSNYLLGNDPQKWRTGVPQYARVRYESVYPGINLVFYGDQGQLEYDFQVAPGADPAQAELEFRGAEQVQLQDGVLVIRTGQGRVSLQAPRVYQETGGERRPVDGRFVLRGANRVGFAIGSYDRSRELIIDPILTFSTYFGGTGDEHATSVAVDGTGNIYLAGSTTSADLPTTLGTTLTGAGPNVYIAKITPPLGSPAATLEYVTYLGGNGQDIPAGIKVDSAGQPYVAGTTSSSDFPTTSTAYQPTLAAANVGKQHVFVTQLRADATAPLYSTYLSGNGVDLATGMAINAAGYVFVTGTTTSNETSTAEQFPATNLPQAVPYQPSSKAAPGVPQFFVTEVNPAALGGGSIPYSTYFGGGTFVGTFDPLAPPAVGGGIAVDTSNNVYFTGTTKYTFTGCPGCSTTDFPILNAFQPCLDTAPPSAIVTSPTCANTSVTKSDAFVAKLNLNPHVAQGSQLVWSTYLGGTGDDSSAGVAVDSGAANVYVVGTTNSSDIASNITSLTTSQSFQRCLDTPVNPAAGTACTAPTSPATDAFVARLSNPAASTTASTPNLALTYFSYIGGTGADTGAAITVDNGSGALVTGSTQSSDFRVVPPSNSIQSTFGGVQDAFIARIYTAATTGQTAGSWSTYYGGAATDAGTGIALDVNQNTYAAGETNSAPQNLPTDLQMAKPLTSAQGGGYAGGYDAFVTQLGSAMTLTVQGTLTQGTNQQNFVSAGNQATFTYIVQNNGPDLANNITLIDNLNSSVTGVPLTFVSASVSSGTCGGVSTNAIVSCSLPSLQAGSTATVTIVVTPTGSASGDSQFFNGGTVQLMAPGNILLFQTSVGATMSDFRMSVSPVSQSVAQAGLTANYTVTLAPSKLYASSITVSCSNLPTGASCRATPSSSITLQGASASSVGLAVTTTARPVTTGAANFLRRNFYALCLAFPGLMLFGIGGNPRRRRIARILTLCALFSMLLLIPACSKSTTQTPVSGTPAGNYTITITASSGSDSKSATVTLSVP
jgi:uncharacterized repeat protein (TIGR01451 family)